MLEHIEVGQCFKKNFNEQYTELSLSNLMHMNAYFPKQVLLQNRKNKNISSSFKFEVDISNKMSFWLNLVLEYQTFTKEIILFCHFWLWTTQGWLLFYFQDHFSFSHHIHDFVSYIVLALASSHSKWQNVYVLVSYLSDEVNN